jgi:hypothetical protein
LHILLVENNADINNAGGWQPGVARERIMTHEKDISCLNRLGLKLKSRYLEANYQSEGCNRRVDMKTKNPATANPGCLLTQFKMILNKD